MHLPPAAASETNQDLDELRLSLRWRVWRVVFFFGLRAGATASSTASAARGAARLRLPLTRRERTRRRQGLTHLGKTLGHAVIRSSGPVRSSRLAGNLAQKHVASPVYLRCQIVGAPLISVQVLY